MELDGYTEKSWQPVCGTWPDIHNVTNNNGNNKCPQVPGWKTFDGSEKSCLTLCAKAPSNLCKYVQYYQKTATVKCKKEYNTTAQYNTSLCMLNRKEGKEAVGNGPFVQFETVEKICYFFDKCELDQKWYGEDQTDKTDEWQSVVYSRDVSQQMLLSNPAGSTTDHGYLMPIPYMPEPVADVDVAFQCLPHSAPCQQSGQYEKVTPNSDRNRECSDYKTCDSETEYVSKEPTLTENRFCGNCNKTIYIPFGFCKSCVDGYTCTKALCREEDSNANSNSNLHLSGRQMNDLSGRWNHNGKCEECETIVVANAMPSTCGSCTHDGDCRDVTCACHHSQYGQPNQCYYQINGTCHNCANIDVDVGNVSNLSGGVYHNLSGGVCHNCTNNGICTAVTCIVGYFRGWVSVQAGMKCLSCVHPIPNGNCTECTGSTPPAATGPGSCTKAVCNETGGAGQPGLYWHNSGAY